MRNHQQVKLDDKSLYRVVDKFELKDYKPAICTIIFLAGLILSFIAIAFKIMPDVATALLVIVVIVCACLLGGGIASLFTPITSTEETRFPRILGTLGGAVSGFTLAKIDSAASYFAGYFKATLPPEHPIEIGYMLVAPLACFLASIILAAVLRTSVISYEENRLQILRRKLWEQGNA
jgi:hypothetical protein